jgi:sugar lactone lactonase YvrE
MNKAPSLILIVLLVGCGQGDRQPVDTPEVTLARRAELARVAAASYALNVKPAGSQSGIVTSSPAGIDCGTPCSPASDGGAPPDGGATCGAGCSSAFTSGEVVTLTATPAAGATFAGWFGNGCSGTGPCTLTMSAARTVVATFGSYKALGCYADESAVPDLGFLAMNSAANTVEVCAERCAYDGYGYAGVDGDECWCGDTYGRYGKASNCTTQCPANFAETCGGVSSNDVYQTGLAPLVVTPAGTGGGTVASSPAGINCGATCRASFPPDTVVTLTATVDPYFGSTFTGWSGACSGAGTCTVTMSAAKAVTANFHGSFTKVGCFADQPAPDLSGPSRTDAYDTPLRCAEWCASQGYAYAGVQDGNECFCGSWYGRYGTAQNCTSACAGNSLESCGGVASNEVYATTATPPPPPVFATNPTVIPMPAPDADAGTMRSPAFSSDGTDLAAADANRVAAWSLEQPDGGATPTLLGTFNRHTARINSVGFAPSGTELVSSADDGTTRISSASSFAQVRSLAQSNVAGNPAAFSPDGTKILAASGDEANLYNASTGALLGTLTGHASTVLAVAFSPDGTLALTGGADHKAILWNTATFASVATLSAHVAAVNAVEFSPDGAQFLTASDDATIRFWSTTTHAQVAPAINQQGRAVKDAKFSADGAYVVSCDGDTSASGGNAYLYARSTGLVVGLFTMAPSQARITGVALSPDETTLATTFETDPAVNAGDGGASDGGPHDAGPRDAGGDADAGSSAPERGVYLWTTPLAANPAPPVKTVAFVPGVTVTTLAGSGVAGTLDGKGAAAELDNPTGIAIDKSGNLIVADYAACNVRKVTPTGVVTTLGPRPSDAYPARTAFINPFAVAVATNGTYYVATDDNPYYQKGAATGTIWLLPQPADGGAAAIATLADGGVATTTELGDAGNEMAVVMTGYDRPRGLAPMAQGNLLVVQRLADVVDVLTVSDAMTSALAGTEGTAGYAEGTGASAMFNRPVGAAPLPGGAFAIADRVNNRIRKVSAAGVVTTLAGDGIAALSDGTAALTELSSPEAVAADAAGNLYVSDTGTHRIRRILTNGTSQTLAGNGTAGYADGPGSEAEFYGQEGIAVTPNGKTVYVADGDNGDDPPTPYHRIRVISVP